MLTRGFLLVVLTLTRTLRVVAITLAVATALFLPVAGGAGHALAAEFRSGASPSIESEERIDDDLYISGGTIRVDGQVTGDLVATGGTVNADGPVDGNVNIAGGNVTVGGPVGGTVRVAAGTVTIDADVTRDVVVAGGTVRITSNAQVGQDLVVAGGTVTVDGPIGRDVRAGGGDFRLNSTVGGNVRVDLDGRLTLTDNASIDGDLIYEASSGANIADGATVAGTTTREQPAEQSTGSRVVDWILSTLLRLAWALLVGTAIVLLVPRTARIVTDTLRERPVVSLGWGVALLIAVPLLALVLVVTIVGVPLALIALGLLLLAAYLSQIVVGITLGRLLLRRTTTRIELWVAMLVGVTIVVLIRLLPIPYGWTTWVSLLIAVLAIGAIWTELTGWGRYARVPERAATAAPPPA